MRDELIHRAQTIEQDELPFFMGDLEVARAIAQARLNVHTRTSESSEDRLLNIKEAAARLRVSVSYLQKNHDKLPFAQFKVSGIGRHVLFSNNRITEFIANSRTQLSPRRRMTTLQRVG